MRSYNYLLFFVAHDLHRIRRFPSHFTCLSDNMLGLIAGSDIQRIPSAGTPLFRHMYTTFVTLWLQVVQPLANVHETKWTPHVKRETDVAQSYTSSGDIT